MHAVMPRLQRTDELQKVVKIMPAVTRSVDPYPARLTLLLTLLLALLGCGGDSRADAETAGQAAGDGEAFKTPLREAVLEPTGVVIRSDLEGTVPDPVQGPAVLDRHGRLYIRSHEPGVLVRWTATGEYDGAMSSHGEGPGELGPIQMLQMRPEGDTVHVIHRVGRWSRLTPDGTVEQIALSDAIAGATLSGMEVLPDGRILLPLFDPVREAHGVGVVGRNGDLDSFLQASPTDDEVWGRGVGVALAGNGDVWVGPVEVGEDFYALERWTLEGDVVDRVEREIDWIPHGVVGGEEMGLTMRVRRHADRMLHVSARVPHPNADQGAFAGITGVVRAYGRFEILDLERRTLQASAWLGRHPESVGSISGALPGSDLNFRISPDPDGVPELTMQRLVLDGC